MAFTFNQTIFRDTVVKAIGDNFIDEAFKEAQNIFNKDKEQTILKEFNEDEITQEIEEGPDAENISGTLGGRGNLFSFIGFNQGDDPIGEVRRVLIEDIYLQKIGRGVKYKKESITYFFPFYFPSDVELDNAAPMPWGTARSWLKAIENGISGLNYYLFKKGKIIKNSRSGPAVQLTGKKGEILNKTLGNIQFTPRDYLTRMFEEFKEKYR